MSHLDHLKKEAELRNEREVLLEEAKHEVFIVNDLLQKFGRSYLDYLHEENKSFAERHNYETIIRPIPIEAAQ